MAPAQDRRHHDLRMSWQKASTPHASLRKVDFTTGGRIRAVLSQALIDKAPHALSPRCG